MKNKLGRLLLCVLFAGLTTAWAVAQDDTSNASKGEVRNITGCLTKSGGGDEYLLTGTDGSTWEIHDKTGRDFSSVFVPHPPNPASGVFVLVEKSEILELNMTVEEGIRLIISGGAAVPAPKTNVC